MTGWNSLDAAVDWIRRRPVTFFLLCLAAYCFTCLLGV